MLMDELVNTVALDIKNCSQSLKNPFIKYITNIRSGTAKLSKKNLNMKNLFSKLYYRVKIIYLLILYLEARNIHR